MQHLLGRFDYAQNDAVLHTDASFLPRTRRARASWNYRLRDDGRATVTYHLNRLQALDTKRDYSDSSNQPLRWLAEGRDASATIDAANGGFGKNDQDNEITGVHVSDGDPSRHGILGAKVPNLDNPRWRWFYTQQHGDNPTYEVVVADADD